MTPDLALGPTSERAPAKLNLALHVRNRRPDGYHEIETLFAFADFGDLLHAQPADDWSLMVEGPMAAAAGPVADNLVLRAADSFAAYAASDRRYAFRLEKMIPVAAGLGGGSADAAAALRLLNRMEGAFVPETLEAIAADLGADVPACVRSATRFGRGRGERLMAGPTLSGMSVLLVNPRVAVPTGPVFAGWDGIDRGPLGTDWRAARNDLTVPALALQPVIGDVLDWLSALPGATVVRMSGSGATCFALFDGPVPQVTPPADWWMAATRLR